MQVNKPIFYFYEEISFNNNNDLINHNKINKLQCKLKNKYEEVYKMFAFKKGKNIEN